MKIAADIVKGLEYVVITLRINRITNSMRESGVVIKKGKAMKISDFALNKFHV